ncbi:hypothetical protein KDW_39150 [Dictyobacter vulcani]|uniref:Uncharacterized protein n=1 Tax=Dictyobacter vulcani TaxID=2607529 RepID=A0A5J4KQ81_9CHLR|nr:hypothetical protein KDW_39150 [Dictyobacter vulcani]
MPLTIKNMNKFPLKITKLTVFEKSITSVPLTIEPYTLDTVDVEFQATGTQEIQYIHWQLSCDGGGQYNNCTGSLSMPIRRLQVNSIDDMFEEF